MADTFTSNYNWTLPEVGASSTTWGTKLNANFADVDLKVKANATAIATNASSITSLTTTVAGKLDKSGGTMTGFIVLHADPASAMNPATKQYVDTAVAGATPSLTAYMQKANNLSDLANAATARTNLGLGTAAVVNTGTGAGNAVVLDGSSKLPAVDGSQLTNLPTPAGYTQPTTVGAIGTYALLRWDGTGAITPGTTKSANLRYTGQGLNDGGAATGTWQCMGYIAVNGEFTLWLRVS